MNKIAILELVLVGVIVIFQTIQGNSTRKKINVLRSIIPKLDFFKIEKYNIPIENLQTYQPKEILDDLFAYQIKNSNNSEQDILDEPKSNPDLFTTNSLNDNPVAEEISLISPNDWSNEIFNSLLHSINVYLLRNKGATTDFNLIKDITERNIDAEEEDISQSATIPLYLGLMGTMCGIIFGLINLFIISDIEKDFEITGFLGGVSIAMFASLYGLAWTVYNASYKYKKARKSVEIAKNDFYTFIQTELLPIINQSVSSSVFMLHTNLVKFNDSFTININRLSGLLNKNYDALIAQDNILQSLENIDITEFAKANVKVLSELKNGTSELHKFNQYLKLLNSTVEGTSKLSHSFDSLLSRVNNFEGFAEKLDSRIDESNKLVQFLNDHYQLLTERGDLINDSIKKVDDVLIKSLVELQDHTNSKIEAIKEITIKEEDLMTKAFAENRSHFSKLSILVDLNKSIDEIKSDSYVQIISINDQITLLKESLDKTNAVLTQINNRSFALKTQNVTKSIKSIFTSK